MPEIQAQMDRHAAQDQTQRHRIPLQILWHRLLDPEMSHPVTNTLAMASLAMPLWLPSVADISQDAAIATPILIAIFWFFQAMYSFRKWHRK